MRRTKADAAVTREHLLDAAQACFLAHGYTETNLEDVAKTAGTTRGAIQWHFGSKAELFNALVQERSERAVKKMQPAAGSRLGPLEALRRLMVGWISLPEEDEDFCAMLKLGVLGREMGMEHGEGTKEKSRCLLASLGSFTWLIRKGIAAEEIRADVQPAVAGRAALGVIYGMYDLWLSDPTAFSLKSTAEETVDIFLRGIACEGVLE
jgi:TetR/AcrR family acrAB operon transcriptional repressor